MKDWPTAVIGALLAFTGSLALLRIQIGNSDRRRMRDARAELELLALLDDFPIAQQMQRVRTADAVSRAFEPPRVAAWKYWAALAPLMVGVGYVSAWGAAAMFDGMSAQLVFFVFAGIVGGVLVPLAVLRLEAFDDDRRSKRWGRLHARSLEWAPDDDERAG